MISLILFTGACLETDSSEFYVSKIIDQELFIEKIDEIILNYTALDETDPKIGRLRPEFVANHDNSLFAFYDELNHHFVISNDQGEILHFVSKRGRGPGELMSVLGYNFDEENRIIAYDGNQKMIKIYDLNGEYNSDVEIDRTTRLVGNRYLFVSNENIIVPVINSEFQSIGLENVWRSELIGIFEYDGKFLDSFGTYDPHLENPNSYLVFPIMDADLQKNQILSGHPDQYSMQLYDLGKKDRLAWFGLKTENFNQSEEYIDAQQSHQAIRLQAKDLSWTSGVYFLSDYLLNFFVILTEDFQQTRDHNEKIHYITLYDRNTYDSYGEIELPYYLGSVIEDQLYLIEDDNPEQYTIGVYEILSVGQ